VALSSVPLKQSQSLSQLNFQKSSRGASELEEKVRGFTFSK